MTPLCTSLRISLSRPNFQPPASEFEAGFQPKTTVLPETKGGGEAAVPLPGLMGPPPGFVVIPR